MRKTYRATKNTETVCFCGRSIRIGQPIRYVKTSEIPPNFAAVRGPAYNRAHSHAAHIACVEDWLNG